MRCHRQRADSRPGRIICMDWCERTTPGARLRHSEHEGRGRPTSLQGESASRSAEESPGSAQAVEVQRIVPWLSTGVDDAHWVGPSGCRRVDVAAPPMPAAMSCALPLLLPVSLPARPYTLQVSPEGSGPRRNASGYPQRYRSTVDYHAQLRDVTITPLTGQRTCRYQPTTDRLDSPPTYWSHQMSSPRSPQMTASPYVSWQAAGAEGFVERASNDASRRATVDQLKAKLRAANRSATAMTARLSRNFKHRSCEHMLIMHARLQTPWIDEQVRLQLQTRTAINNIDQ